MSRLGVDGPTMAALGARYSAALKATTDSSLSDASDACQGAGRVWVALGASRGPEIGAERQNGRNCMDMA